VAGDDSEIDGRMSDIPLNSSKASLRATALAARDALSSERRAAAAETIARRGLPFAITPGAVVAGYSPIRSEIDPIPLMRKLAMSGAQLALPAIMPGDQPLKFRAWSPDDRLQRGRLGILEPSADAKEVTPDILLVPLAAFDHAGHRIGYGAGHYDRTLEQLRKLKAVTAVGVAAAVQEVEAVPALLHDAVLDYVLTETQVLDLRSL
jgi:5-formyltetrahydrofolate cyclo-ligase